MRGLAQHMEKEMGRLHPDLVEVCMGCGVVWGKGEGRGRKLVHLDTF
jgi:hypothetical protein